MRAVWGILLAVVALVAQAQERNLVVAEQRVALVIGNGSYKVGPLRNPVNDARAMTQALKKAGFDVSHRENLSHRQMFEATRDFGEKLKPGAVALFYYAGHGLQVRDRNYLIPVEADLKHEDEAPYSSIDVTYALDVMNRARTRVNIVILDACRNNPFARNFRSGSSGLAQMEAPSGTLIAYATAPGRVASDGSGDHGIYTRHLLEQLPVAGLPVEIVFKRVREGVERETKSQQVPWESSSLKGDFAFIAAAPAPARPAAPVAAPESAFELAFWDSIKASSQVADYQAYLAQYPGGRFAPLAKARINSLDIAAAKPAPMVAAPPPAPAPVSAPPAPPAQVAAVAPTLVASGKGPAVGERYVYQYTDLWRPGEKLQVSHAVTAVSGTEITESISTRVGRRTVTSEAQWPAAAEMRQSRLGNLQLREFAPFALALGLVGPGQPPEAVKGMPPEDADTPEWSVRAAVSQEDVSVPAGRFRAVKLSLAGTRGGEAPGKNRIHTFDMSVWYAQESKRYVKLSFTSYARTGSMGSTVQDREVYELVSSPQFSAPVAPPPEPAAQVAAVAPLPPGGGAARPPAVGDRWVYQYTDLWKPAEKLQVTHAVTAVNASEIVEQVSAVLNRRSATGEAVWPAAAAIGEWKIEGMALREFSPFALALGLLKPGQPPARVRAMPPETSDAPEWSVRATVSEEEVSVPAGRFQAVKLVLAGRRPIPPMTGLVQPHHFEMTVWYAAQTSRAVKMTFDSFARVGNISSSAQHRDVYELVSAPR